MLVAAGMSVRETNKDTDMVGVSFIGKMGVFMKVNGRMMKLKE